MKIGEQFECWILQVIKMKAPTGGGKGRHLWPRLAEKIAEAQTLYQYQVSTKKAKIMIKNKCTQKILRMYSTWFIIYQV